MSSPPAGFVQGFISRLARLPLVRFVAARFSPRRYVSTNFEPTRFSTDVVERMKNFPWRDTLATLRERFREDRLALTAGSLTFTTTIALVPLLAVVLSVLTAVPVFAKFQDVLQRWLVESLVPDNISQQVLGYLTQFARRAGRLGWAGFGVLLLTALGLIYTIDRTFNNIWRVQRPRAWGQRLLIYWAAISLGPLLLAVSLVLTSSMGLPARGGGGVLRLLLDTLEFFFVAFALAATYHYVPNTRVRWGPAWTGAIFAALTLEAAKTLLTLYIKSVPTWSVVYGAFATVPILLVWIYTAWVIVLLGAVIVAYLPTLTAGVARRAPTPGWQFELALEVIGQLQAARRTTSRGLSLMQIARRLRIDPLQLEPVAEALERLDWIGRLTPGINGAPMRLILLVEPEHTPLSPLVACLLLPRVGSAEMLWRNANFSTLSLQDALAQL